MYDLVLMKRKPRTQRPPAPGSELVLTINEVAAQLRSSHFFVRDEINKRHLAHLRFGRRFYVRQADVDAYMQRVRRAALGEEVSAK
jgi:excisionase family DNA binding protein